MENDAQFAKIREKLLAQGFSEEVIESEIETLKKDLKNLKSQKELPKSEVYKIEVHNLDQAITITNKDSSFMKMVKLTSQAKSVFGGRTRFFAKCRVFENGEFRIVKFLDGKKRF